MRIAFDARWILPERSGIGTCTESLIEQLPAVDPENEYVLLFNRPAVRDRIMGRTLRDAGPRFRAHDVHFSPFSPATQVLLPRLLAGLGVELLFSPGYMIPLGQKLCRTISTIHDVIPLVMPSPPPDTEEARRLALYRTMIRAIAQQANGIVTCSEHSRDDIIRLLDVPAARQPHIVSIPLGVAPDFRPPATRDATTKTVLYVGRPDPYKNLVGLVEAFSIVRWQVADAVLRIVGPRDPWFVSHVGLAEELGLGDAVRIEGHVDHADLVRAYQQASVVVLPSLYEGFGLPALEAMACGTPVVCSNTSSLPEVVGDAALMVDPKDTQALADAITKVLTDPELAADLGRRGIQNAARFSWRRAAEQTVEFMRCMCR